MSSIESELYLSDESGLFEDDLSGSGLVGTDIFPRGNVSLPEKRKKILGIPFSFFLAVPLRP